MDRQPDLWNALRAHGIDADDPQIREAVRATLATITDVEQHSGRYVARRCAEAIHQALAYQLQHPDTDDMSRFEDEWDGDTP